MKDNKVTWHRNTSGRTDEPLFIRSDEIWYKNMQSNTEIVVPKYKRNKEEKQMKNYRTGFSTCGEHRISTVEWLYDAIGSNDDRLMFQAYDANLCPLPDLSKWKRKEYIFKQIKKGLEFTSDFNGEVWMDDVKIK
jgi:hypothetical protein